MYCSCDKIQGRITKVVKCLGEGMFGRTSLVEYDGRLSCCKMSDNMDNLQVYINEAGMYERVNGKGGCPRLYACAEDSPLIVMEYCRGETLAQLECTCTMPLRKWLKVYLSIVRNVKELHSLNLIHSDLHSENILIDICQNGDIQTSLIDLGLCRENGGFLKLDFEKADGGTFVSPKYDIGYLGRAMTDTFERDEFLGTQGVEDVKDLCTAMCSRNKPTLQDIEATLVRIINDLESAGEEEASTAWSRIMSLALWIISLAINTFADVCWKPLEQWLTQGCHAALDPTRAPKRKKNNRRRRRRNRNRKLKK